MCNDKGFPLRWEVLAGRRSDSIAMRDMVEDVARLPWLNDVPVVMDRAMGHSACLQDLLRSDVNFVTALGRNEFDSYAAGVPFGALQDVDVETMTAEQAALHAAEAVRRAGLTPHCNNQWVLELGIVQRSNNDPSDELLHDTAASDPLAQAMNLSRKLQLGVDQQRHGSYAAASRAMGITTSLGRKYLRLQKLHESIQRDILDGKAAERTLTQLLCISRMPRTNQLEAFATLLASAAPQARNRPKPGPRNDSKEQPTIRVRAVACFNPEMFVEMRKHAANKINSVRTSLAQLQAKIDRQPKRYKPDAIRSQIDRILHKESLLDVYDVHVCTCQKGYRIEALLDKNRWARRRRLDGWSILVANPRMKPTGSGSPWTAGALCDLYRSKDTVEKDFRTIKSFLHLRPVRHRNDDKVRAHVAVCILALLLERKLQHQLRVSKAKMSAATALQSLEPCRLNRFAPRSNEPPAYLLTQPTPEQRQILKALRMKHLADDEFAIECINKAF
jgi:hypothetical protein